MKNKNSFLTVLKFSFLVWVKSVFLIMLFGFIGYSILDGDHLSTIRLSDLTTSFGITALAYLYTTPYFLIMLVAVYLVNRLSIKINFQKLLIFAIYTLPFLYLEATIGFKPFGDKHATFGMVLLLGIPAVIIYFEKLLPRQEPVIEKASREDVIDDINFEE